MAAATAVVIVALLLTGQPQRVMVERIAEHALGASVDVEWGGFLGDLRLDSLRIYGRPKDKESGSPFLVATGVRVDYRLGGKGGLGLRSIAIEELAIHMDATDPEDENFAFVRSLLDAEPGDEDPAYMPEMVSIGTLSVEADFPDASFSVGNLRLSVEIESSDAMKLTIAGESIPGSYRLASPEISYSVSGADLRATFTLAGESIEATFTARVPEFMDVKGRGSILLGEESGEFDLSLESLSLNGVGFAEIAEQLDIVPLSFDEARLTECVVTGNFEAGVWPKAHASLEVAGLSVGDPGNELYEGDAGVSLSMEGGETGMQGEAKFTFAQGQEVRVDFASGADAGHVTAVFDQWSKEEFLNVVPVAFRASVAELGFSSVSGRYEGKWFESGFGVNINLRSSTAEGTSIVPLLVALDARASTAGHLSIEGDLEAKLGDELIQATAYYGAEGRYRIDILIGDVGLGPWVSLLAGQRLPEGASATLAGTIQATSAGEGKPIVITPDLALTSLSYGETSLDRIDVTGRMSVAEDLKSLSVERLSAEASDYVTRVVLEGWDYTIEARRGGGRFEGALDLGLIGAASGLADLYGDVSFEGTVSVDDGKVAVPVSFVSEYIGYGDLAVPYGSELRGAATLTYALDDSEGVLRDLAMTIGEGTKITVGDTKFSPSPFHAQGDFVLESDLQVLVDLDWFQFAEGKALEKSSFEISEDGLSVDWHVSFDASRLVLPEDAAFVSGVEFTAAGTYDGELNGAGKVFVRELSVAGGTVHAIEGDAELRGTRLIVPAATGRLFEGWTKSRLEVGLLEENVPVLLKVEMTGIDLAVMTDEVKPPKVRLTGFSDGLLEVEYSLEGLQGLYLKVSSAENLSVNRDFIEELLQSEGFLSGAGAKVAEKAMAKLLGDAPQRPFDSGTLSVYLTEDTIQGVAELKSEKTKAYNGLNLTVNLDMDQSALAEALRMLEESALAEMEF
ncbi:MAG: hypothetical protein QGD90_07950 [Candidatus Hydrogenedentes bacterium]|nr:hypothetical protein [Candidatus Hydrogenedentota bacterium]